MPSRFLTESKDTFEHQFIDVDEVDWEFENSVVAGEIGNVNKGHFEEELEANI